MAKLILNPETPFAREISLQSGKITIGRSPGNDIQINDTTISSLHCELIVTDAAVTIRDSGSTNGSFINGQRIEKAVLQSGELIRLGQVEIRFDFGEITVAIPKIEAPQDATSVILADGLVSCLNHLEIPGLYQCTECGRAFCDSCVRHLPRITGGALLFCPLCSNAQCVEHENLVVARQRDKKKTSLLQWLQQTLRIKSRPRQKRK